MIEEGNLAVLAVKEEEEGGTPSAHGVMLTSVDTVMSKEGEENGNETEKLEFNLKDEIESVKTSNGQSEIKKKEKTKKNPLLVAAFETYKPTMPSYIAQNEPVLRHQIAELDSALDNTISKKKAPDISMCNDLMIYAPQKNLEAIYKDDYDRAAQIDEAVKIIYEAILIDQTQYDRDLVQTTHMERIGTVDNQINALNSEYQSKCTLHEQDTKRRLLILESEHQKQIEEFEEVWMSPITMQQYSKPSAELLQKRKTQKHLALSHDYEEAKYVKSLVIALEQEETEAAKRRASEAMKANYAQLIERQEKEKKCIELNAERKAKQIEKEYQNELESLEKTKQALKNKSPSPKKSSPDFKHVPQNRFMKGSMLQTDQKLDVKIDVKVVTKSKTPRQKQK